MRAVACVGDSACVCVHGLRMNNGLYFRSMGKGGRKRKRRVERMYEKGEMGAWMPEASLKSLKVSISALESDKDEDAEGGEEGKRGREKANKIER